MKPTIFDTLSACVEKSGKFLMEDAPWENKDFYAAWLSQACYYICHSTRLLALTAANIPPNDNSMHYRFLKHCAEEKGHENLPVMDMKAVGRDIANFPEFAVTQAFYQTQYYQIEHIHPHAFFGYILFLESLACDYGPKLSEKIEKIHGPKAISFLKVHSDADIEHVRDALERVAKLPMEQQMMVQENIKMTAELYWQLCQQALEVGNNMGKIKKAA
ncbi:iron-containing redox enzyme family protein [Bdellovibrio reynosensis]|uniref:Iron-containing redox enzyme family protein n=1 Tax=Bdellovibrio reynosensis TaxID=2835041 RepID=A0ABY4CA91_9BACT|nr:iron-containing redox enzyme family protein [Bdellovibrio reynosensis]UOF01659.1 iron-containing redox enzyme family protein [Bdellovibrio reynosensis]